MDNKMENIDRFFNERLVNYEEIPPDANWNRISQRLGHKQRKRVAILIFRFAAGMALLLSTGIGVYMLTKSDSQPRTSAISANQSDEINTIHPEYRTAPIQTITPQNNNIAKNKDLLDAGKHHTSVSNLTTGKSGAQENRSIESVVGNDYVAYNGQGIENEKSTVGSLTAISGIYPDRVQQKEIPHEIRFALVRIQHVAVSTIAPDDFYDAHIPEDVRVKKSDRWTIGSEVAPLYSYRTISSDELQSATIDELNEKENGRLAYSGGIRVAFSTGKRLSVQSGIYYSRYGQQTNNVETVAVNYLSNIQGKLESETFVSVANSTGVISKTSGKADKINLVAHGDFEGANYSNRYDAFPFSSNMNQTYSNTSEADIILTQYFDYLEVPLVLRYKIIDRKIDLNLTGGMITNFLFSNRVNITRNGNTEFFGETTNIRHINYQGSVGMGIEYPVKSGFSFTMEPRFRYYINPIDRTAEINVHPYSFGFFAGFNYMF